MSSFLGTYYGTIRNGFQADYSVFSGKHSRNVGNNWTVSDNTDPLDRRSSGLFGRIISEQDERWLNKHGIICNTCAEMLLATARRCYIRHARVLSRAPGAERAYASPSVACLRTDIFSFRSYWHKGSALVCTYVGTSRSAAETPTFRANKTTYARDLSSLLPPSFDLETPESINGSSDFTFLKCRGVRRSFGNARRIFLGFFSRCREMRTTSQNSSSPSSFLKGT